MLRLTSLFQKEFDKSDCDNFDGDDEDCDTDVEAFRVDSVVRIEFPSKNGIDEITRQVSLSFPAPKCGPVLLLLIDVTHNQGCYREVSTECYGYFSLLEK